MSNEQPSHAPLKTLALDALHRELGAKMGGFAGFDMPIQYALGLKAEHLHTRAQAGLFDVSHMGQLYITAKDGTMGSLKRGLEAALPIDFDGWPIDLQKYSYLLNDQGGIEDDLMLTLRSDHVRMVVNAGNRDADLLLLQRLAPDLHFNWVDAALLALQGPAAQSALAALDTEGNAANLSFMQATDVHLFGKPCYTTRSGYTGEDGYEISIPTAVALQVARQLLADPRVQCIGLGARDSLHSRIS